MRSDDERADACARARRQTRARSKQQASRPPLRKLRAFTQPRRVFRQQPLRTFLLFIAAAASLVRALARSCHDPHARARTLTLALALICVRRGATLVSHPFAIRRARAKYEPYENTRVSPSHQSLPPPPPPPSLQHRHKRRCSPPHLRRLDPFAAAANEADGGHESRATATTTATASVRFETSKQPTPLVRSSAHSSALL